MKSKRLIWSAVGFGAAFLVAGCGSSTEISTHSTSTLSPVPALTTANSTPSVPSATQPHAAEPGDPTPAFIPNSAVDGGTENVPDTAGDGGSGAAPGDPTEGSIPGSAGDGGSGLVPGEQPAAGTYCGAGYNELAVWAFGAGCDTAMAVQSKYGAQLTNSGSKSTSVEVVGLTWICDEYTGHINPYLQCSSDGGAIRLTS